MVPPAGDGEYPDIFQCPFRECESQFRHAIECDKHVASDKHPMKIGHVEVFNPTCILYNYDIRKHNRPNHYQPVVGHSELKVFATKLP